MSHKTFEMNKSDTKPLTPTGNGCLPHVVSEVRVHDPDKQQVLQQTLHQHPHEGGEDEVVQQCSHGDTAVVVGGALYAGQEHHPGEEQRQGQLEQRLLRPSLPEFSEVGGGGREERRVRLTLYQTELYLGAQ